MTGVELAAVMWLCRPGMANNPCTVPFMRTVIVAGKRVRTEAASPSKAPKFDCFYVYPTVSSEHTDIAPQRIEPAERDVAVAQGSPFSQLCNVWAPLYRQLTLAALLDGHYYQEHYQRVAYASVLEAWRVYLTRYNGGRPIVFIGHSQGAQLLIRLIENEIEPNAVLRKRFALAILLGGNFVVANNPKARGSFSRLQPCTPQRRSGCVIAYSSFAQQPPENSLFAIPGQGISLPGETAKTGVSVVCSNPAGFTTGAAPLTMYLTTRDKGYWWAPNGPAPPRVQTRWVEYPGLFTAQCTHRGNATWLNVTRNGNPKDWPHLFIDTPDWGLHRYDMSLALGALIHDVQAAEGSYESVLSTAWHRRRSRGMARQ